jgi:hypothetical protein
VVDAPVTRKPGFRERNSKNLGPHSKIESPDPLVG